MQLDLQSHGAFAPKILEIGLLRLRLIGSFLQDLYPELSPASPGAHWQESPPALFRSNWVKHDYTFPDWIGKNEKTFVSIQWTIVIVFDPVGPKKCWRWFPATGPLEKRETALDGSRRKHDPFWGEEDQFPTFWGQKFMRMYWKIPFQRTANPTA